MRDAEIQAIYDRLTTPHPSQPTKLEKGDYLIRSVGDVWFGWIVGRQITASSHSNANIVRQLNIKAWELAANVRDAKRELDRRNREARSILERITDG